MQSMQERILCRIEEMARAAKLEPAVQHHYANCGSVFFHRKGEIVPIGETSFMFDSAYYKLDITWKGKRLPSQVGRNDYFDFYQKYSEPSRYWEVLAEAMGY